MRQLYLLMIAMFLSLMSGQSAFAQLIDIDSFRTMRSAFFNSIKAVQVSVDDNVKGGCLPRPQGLKKKMEAHLRENGFSILGEGDIPDARVILRIAGLRTEAGCVGYINTVIAFFVYGYVPESEYVEPATSSYIGSEFSIGALMLSGFNTNMQMRLEKVAELHAKKLQVEVMRGKLHLLKNINSQ
ncbi:hypothetical protein SAMN05444141_101215 [Pseudovibrio denitrificans]|uniref:Uncharacterized protein n=1 Tax=Pseudovibrio denitrificans TaxID=258256 RepID=A0A1I6XIZ0_9HYPH|nr:hypothetical protein [Pseudovibrio denitrificans]SFT38011.1 hypothetical protein SAMN05444141_101215 [Pseudovibrio denitrificans]